MLVLLCIGGVVPSAFAGPPLLCHPFDIGSARSLPWSTGDWFAGKADYDLSHLVADTESILTPSTPVIVRMETLRRAAIYASHDPKIAQRLYLTTNDRVRSVAAASGGKTDPLTLFDAGYLTETFREIGRLVRSQELGAAMHAAAIGEMVKNADGYALVQQSLALRSNDPSIELASALIAASSPDRRGQYAAHAGKARAGANQDALLGRNLDHIAN